MGDHHRIGAGAPISPDGRLDHGVADLHIKGLQVLHALADDGEGGLAVKARVDGDAHGLAAAILGLVEGDLQEIRALRGGVARPAHIEGNRGRRQRSIFRAQIKAVGARGDGGGNTAHAIAGCVKPTIGDAARGFDPLETPAPVRTIPLVIIAHAIERPDEATLGRGLASGPQRHDVKTRHSPFR